MPYTQEQLQQYLDHPETIDASNDELVRALAQFDGPIAELGDIEEGEKKTVDGEIDAETRDAAEAKAEADAKVAADIEAEKAAKAKATETPSADPAPDAGKDQPAQQPAGVLTKDGKHVIPMSVLNDERAGREAAERALAATQRSLLAAAERLKALEAGQADPGQGDEKTVDELEAMFSGLTEDAPWISKIRVLIDRVKTLEARFAEEDRQAEETEEQQQERLRGEARAAISANPTLVLWQRQAPQLWQEAQEMDMALRSRPDVNQMYPTFEKRFARVVELVTAAHQGEAIPLPQPVELAAAQPAAAGKPAEKASSQVLKKAAEVLERAGAQGSVTTLSDIPTGASELSMDEALARMSPQELQAKFDRMNSSQILDFVMGIPA